MSTYIFTRLYSHSDTEDASTYTNVIAQLAKDRAQLEAQRDQHEADVRRLNKPLVLLLSDFESTDVSHFADFVTLLSSYSGRSCYSGPLQSYSDPSTHTPLVQSYPPVVLVLGISSSLSPAYRRMSLRSCQCLDLEVFALRNTDLISKCLWSELMLGGKSPVVLTLDIWTWLRSNSSKSLEDIQRKYKWLVCQYFSTQAFSYLAMLANHGEVQNSTGEYLNIQISMFRYVFIFTLVQIVSY